MRNFMCVLLLALLNQSASLRNKLHCYETADASDCTTKYIGKPDYRKNALSCLKELEEKSNECSPSEDTCTKAIVTYEDNDTLIFTSCDSEQDKFRKCKKLLKKKLSELADKKVKSKECEKCKEDNCNLKTKKAETTTILSPEITENTKAPSKDASKSTEILVLPNIAMLIFVVLIFSIF